MNDKTEEIKKLLENIPHEDFKIQNVFGHSSLSGVAVVKNNKLAGRIEDIKFLDSVEPNLREQFLKEGKVLSAMQHANIPRIYDIRVHEDVLLFRSEHIEGYSLREVMNALHEQNRKLPNHVSTSITLKLLKALEYTHNKVSYEGKKESIIHCDIKPENIILSVKDKSREDKIDDAFLDLVEQNKAEPYLIDFGIARFKGKASDNNGTLSYLSPIQAGYGDLARSIDWRTDLYQLLLVFFELVTGTKPYSNLPREKVLELKKTQDFEVPKNKNVSKQTKQLIEKGTKRDPSHSFDSEKECIKSLSKINSTQRRNAFLKKHRKPVISVCLLILIIPLAFAAYDAWDYQTRSTDALIRQIESNPNPTIEELETALHKIQKRAFEKKYYEPLLKGEFRDPVNGTPLYPSHLDAKGNWVLDGVNNEDAVTFVAMLFNHVDDYPELLDYAVEYAEPILLTDYDGGSLRKYMWALAPAYISTNDDVYLQKLSNVSLSIQHDLEVRRGMIQSIDLYKITLFLWIYSQTGEKNQLEAAENYARQFISNNIDSDGYVYEYSQVNATSPYGPVPDMKMGRLVTVVDVHAIGNHVPVDVVGEDFKESTSIFTRDFAELFRILDQLHDITKDETYQDAQEIVRQYYSDRVRQDKFDLLFVSKINEENNIPEDALATIKMLRFLKKNDDRLYVEKLRTLLSSEHFRSEQERGILSSNVLISQINYDHLDETIKDQSLMITDSLFLELK